MTGAVSPIALFARGLDTEALFLRRRDGTRHPLAISRWIAPADEIDDRVLVRAAGPVLDVGCGPGRHVLALARRGVPAIGVDVAPAAVDRARDRGAEVLLGSIFDPIPGAGRWRTALLLDGNVGIGGHPAALLARLGELLHPSGIVLCELEPPGSPSRRELVALEDGAGERSHWFVWAHVSTDDIASLARCGGYALSDIWTDGGRWFAQLVRVAPHVGARRAEQSEAT